MIDISPEHLAELERFAEIGRLSAGLLHEISNPLTAAMLWLDQCNGKSPYIRHVRNSISLLHRYVEAARQQVRREGRGRYFCAKSELEQVWHILEARASRRGVSLYFTVSGGHTLYGDPVKFQQIIANLVRNATDSYDTCPAGSFKPVRLSMKASRDHLVIKVADKGCGIAEDQLVRLFQPFYTTKSGAGLGIGLSAVKQSVDLDFKGDIRVLSSEGRGTVFTVRLGLAPPAAYTQNHLLPQATLSL